MKKRILIGITLFFWSIILFAVHSYAKDVYCQMPYDIVQCQLLTQGDVNTLNCFKNGKPGSSYSCKQNSSGWTCENKQGTGASLQQLSHADFLNDVKRCDSLCEFCVFDWKPALDKPMVSDQKMDAEQPKEQNQQQKSPPVTGPVDCMTSCKDGPKDYKGEWSRWQCRYDMPAELPIDQPNFDASGYAMCSVRVAGRYRNIEVSKGFKNYKDCFENFCVPKMTEICGEGDRCSNTKNWMRSK